MARCILSVILFAIGYLPRSDLKDHFLIRRSREDLHSSINTFKHSYPKKEIALFLSSSKLSPYGIKGLFP
jgi:hypothetical protein